MKSTQARFDAPSVEPDKIRHLETEVIALRAALVRARAQLAHAQAAAQCSNHQAMHDPLTRLPNRAHFIERLEQALANGKAPRPRFAVFFIDLDRFKAVNDEHGHGVGDEVLRIVAARMARMVRPEDTVGRLGGDEFACLLRNFPGQQELAGLAQSLLDSVSTPITVDTVKLVTQASIGIARFPDDGTTVPSLLRSADMAMYEAKQCSAGFSFANPQCERVAIST